MICNTLTEGKRQPEYSKSALPAKSPILKDFTALTKLQRIATMKKQASAMQVPE